MKNIEDKKVYEQSLDKMIDISKYIKSFANQTVLIKLGGSVIENEDLMDLLIDDIAILKTIGINIVIVHGGGPKINSYLEQLNIKPKFEDGLRVTDLETIKIAEMVLSGQINKEISSKLSNQNIKAIGISGKDGAMIMAKKRAGEIDLGYVGEVESINIDIIKNLLDLSYVPVISPISKGKDNQTYNINADHAALEIAKKIEAQKLIYISDIPGIMEDLNDPSSLIKKINPDQVKKLIDQKIIYGGMIPKVNSCIDGIENGIDSVHIIDGRLKNSLLLEFSSQTGIGTRFERGD